MEAIFVDSAFADGADVSSIFGNQLAKLFDMKFGSFRFCVEGVASGGVHSDGAEEF